MKTLEIVLESIDKIPNAGVVSGNDLIDHLLSLCDVGLAFQYLGFAVRTEFQPLSGIEFA
jgi:hypothetical protein